MPKPPEKPVESDKSSAKKRRPKSAEGKASSKGKDLPVAPRNKKHTPTSRKAMRKVGRTLRTGSATTVLYTKKAVNLFNAFTQSAQTNIDAEQTPFRRVIHFFATLTFPMFLLLSLIVVIIAIMAFSNSTLVVDRQTVSIVGLPRELEGYTILQMSDLHAREFGTRQGVLTRSINNERYDLVVFTGDMVGSSGNAQPFYDLLENMTANRPTFFISGDSDPTPLLPKARDIKGNLEEMCLNDWVLGAQQRGAKYLSYTEAVPVGNVNLWLSPINLLNTNITETVKLLEAQVKREKEGVLSGIEVDYGNLPLSSYRYNTMLLTQQSSARMQPTDMHLALAHVPPLANYMSISQKLSEEGTVAYLSAVDLVLAGHYCGGVWRVPLYGALYVPNALYPRHGWFPLQSDVQGQKMLGLSMLYTSAGLGVTDDMFLPNFRLMNPPQISLLKLTSAITDNLLGE